MSVATDGLLYYGVSLPIGEDCGNELPWDEEDEEKSPFAEEWLDDVLGENHGMEIVTHCSVSYAMYDLAIAKSILTANRGYPKVVPVPLKDDAEWGPRVEYAFATLRQSAGWEELCDPPAWKLASYWES